MTSTRNSTFGCLALLAAGFTLSLTYQGTAAPMGGMPAPSPSLSGPDAGNPTPDRASLNPYQIVATTRITAAGTQSITDAIGDSYGYCDARVSDEYLVDCLGDQLDVIAKSIPKSGDYAAAQKILADTSAKLRSLAATNVAPQKPRIRANGGVNGRSVVSSPLTPVRKAQVKKVNQQAATILQEAETKLLRSADASDRRLIAFAQMAEAVGSNKILLRSA